MGDAEILKVLHGVAEGIGELVERFDGMDAKLKRLEPIEAGVKRLEGQVAAQGSHIRTLSDSVAIIAGVQADMAKALGNLGEQVSRLVEVSVRGRTDDAARYGTLESRVSALEEQVRALAAANAR